MLAHALDLVPTEDIIEALRRRFECLIVTGYRDLDSKSDERILEWRGSSITAIGLLRIAERRVQEYIDAEARDPIE